MAWLILTRYGTLKKELCQGKKWADINFSRYLIKGVFLVQTAVIIFLFVRKNLENFEYRKV